MSDSIHNVLLSRSRVLLTEVMTRIYFSLLLCVVFCNAANNTTGQCGKNELEQMKCRLQVLEKASRTDELETENEMLRNELEEIKTLIASLRQGKVCLIIIRWDTNMNVEA